MSRCSITVAALAIVALGTITSSMPTVAVAQEELIELLRSDLSTQKKAILTEAMEFGPGQADIFWPIYRQYEVDLAKNGDARIALIKDYAAHYEQMTEAKAKELTERSFKLDDERSKLLQAYYKKFEKAMNSSTAARFVQVERKIGLLIDLQIAAEIPLVNKPAQ